MNRLSQHPPIKEKKALALMNRIYILHEEIERLSVSASTSQHPSASTTQKSKLNHLEHARDLHEEKLMRTLAADHTLALRDCLAEDETKVEWSDECYRALNAACIHLEAPLREIVKRAREGNLSGAEEQSMIAVVKQYAKEVRQVKHDLLRELHGSSSNLDSDSDLDLGLDLDLGSHLDFSLDLDSDSDSDSRAQ